MGVKGQNSEVRASAADPQNKVDDSENAEKHAAAHLRVFLTVFKEVEENTGGIREGMRGRQWGEIKR